jgi:hypothetical protein
MVAGMMFFPYPNNLAVAPHRCERLVAARAHDAWDKRIIRQPPEVNRSTIGLDCSASRIPCRLTDRAWAQPRS